MGISPRQFAELKDRVAGKKRAAEPVFESSCARSAASGRHKVILGIDPSLRGTGFGIIRLARPIPQLLAQGTIKCPASWERSRCLVNILRNDSAESVSVQSLRLVGGADIDLQNRTRRDNRGQSGNGADRFLQSQQTLLDRIALPARFENAKDNSLRQCGTRTGSSVREKLRDARLRLDFLVHLFLKRAHLLGRGTLLGNENTASKTAVADWQ